MKRFWKAAFGGGKLFLDVFDGFSYEEASASADAIWNNTHATDGPEAIKRRLNRFAQPSLGRPVYVYKSNIITDELPSEIGTIAVPTSMSICSRLSTTALYGFPGERRRAAS
jgi:hypothetical protein